MEAVDGRMEIVTSYGEKCYHIIGYADCYFYFEEKTLDDMPLRYNMREQRIEAFYDDAQEWDVYIRDDEIFQASFFDN